MKIIPSILALSLTGCSIQDHIPRNNWIDVTRETTLIQSSRVNGHELVATSVPAQIKLTESDLTSCVTWRDYLKIHYGDNVPQIFLEDATENDLNASDCTTFHIDGIDEEENRIVFKPLYTDEFKELETLVCEINGKVMRCARFLPGTPWEAYGDLDNADENLFQWDVYTIQ